jgi:hypothetical protein
MSGHCPAARKDIMTSTTPAAPGARPSRFHATPAEVDTYLRTILAEDVYLRFQQAIGAAALAEAVEDAGAVRAAADSEGLYNADWREGWDDAIQRVNPDQNGPTPVRLIALTDDAPAPAAPEPTCPAEVDRCMPHQRYGCGHCRHTDCQNPDCGHCPCKCDCR